MKKQFLDACGFFLVCAGLALSACQPQPVGIAQSAAVPPQEDAPVVASTAGPAYQEAKPTSTPGFKALWSFQTGAAIWSTPAIQDGVAYTGSDDGNLYAVDASNGEMKWKVSTQGLVRSRPAIAGGFVYFASDDGYLYGVEQHAGKPAWRTDIGNVLDREHPGLSPAPTGYDYLQSSPVVAHGQVYVGSADGNVYALDAATGRINWMYQTGEKVRATPTVDNGSLYVGSWDKTFYALDARTGKELWKTPLGGQVQTTALVADGTVYCASRKASVVALDANTGKIKWEYDYGTNMWVESSPRIYNGILYIGSSGGMVIVGLDSQSGELYSRFYANSFHWSTPGIANDTLYIGGVGSPKMGGKGGLFGLKLVDGKFTIQVKYDLVFLAEEMAESSGIMRGVASSPVIVDGVIYFGALDGRLYAVGVTAITE
jgi:outer membrane protein assembly factor BamB